MTVRQSICICAVLLPLYALAETPQDFSGEWVASDNAASDSGAAQSTPQQPGTHSGMGGHGGGRGGGMGGGGHHGRQSQDSSGATNASASAPVDPRLHAHALIIRQSEVVFDIAADGQRTAYRFDNRNNYGTAYGGTVNLTWATPEMVVETHPDAGGSIEEHYSLSADGKKLTLLTRVQRAGEDTPRESRRVFVRDDGGTAAESHPPTLPL